MANIEVKRRQTKPSRWIFPYAGGGTIAATSQTFTAGRVFLHEFEITTPTIVDQISIINGATAAGEITVGVYGPLVTEETAAGASVAIESASTAQSGTNTAQAISLTATLLQPGRYYAALEGSDNTGTFFRQAATQVQVVGWLQYYDRSGGYGALTNPCPTITNSASVGTAIRVRSTG